MCAVRVFTSKGKRMALGCVYRRTVTFCNKGESVAESELCGMGRVECVTPHEPWFCKRVTPPLPEVGRTRRNNVDVKIRTEGVNEAKTGADV